MTKLTPKREKFWRCIDAGMTQADAYRTAFDAKNMKPETIYKRASELMADREIKGRLAEAQAKLEQKALWTREMSVKALVQAYRDGNASAKVAAVKELNSMHGFNAPQKVEHYMEEIQVRYID